MTSPIASKLGPFALGAVVAVASVSPALAQMPSPAQALLDDAWVFNVGAFVVNSDLKARLDGQSVNNPEINFDDTFGRKNDATRVRADVLWRVTPTHHLRFMYFDNSSDRSRVIDEGLHWGDYTFGSGSKVDFKHELQTFELAYEYAFLREPGYEVSASLGVHYSETTLRLSGDATVTDSEGNVSEVIASTKASSLPAPLPVVGLHGAWVVSPQWVIDAQAQYFKVKVNGFDGYWSDLSVGATWMYTRHLGLGLGYNRFDTRLDVTRDSFNGRLRTGYSGLQAYLTGSF